MPDCLGDLDGIGRRPAEAEINFGCVIRLLFADRFSNGCNCIYGQSIPRHNGEENYGAGSWIFGKNFYHLTIESIYLLFWWYECVAFFIENILLCNILYRSFLCRVCNFRSEALFHLE